MRGGELKGGKEVGWVRIRRGCAGLEGGRKRAGLEGEVVGRIGRGVSTIGRGAGGGQGLKKREWARLEV